MASSAVCRKKRISFTDYVKYKAKRWEDEIIRGGKDEEKKKTVTKVTYKGLYKWPKNKVRSGYRYEIKEEESASVDKKGQKRKY
jgi:hypothetical protein